jgi:hypothetical protein
MGPNDMKLWKEYRICSEYTFILNRTESEHNIYIFADAPHLPSLSEIISLIMMWHTNNPPPAKSKFPQHILGRVEMIE